MTPKRPPVVVIGVGNPMRGDDGVGPAVVAGFDRRFQRLLGWSLYGPHTGIVGGRDPKHLLPSIDG